MYRVQLSMRSSFSEERGVSKPKLSVLLMGHPLRGASPLVFLSGGTRYRSHAPITERRHLRRLASRISRLPISNAKSLNHHITKSLKLLTCRLRVCATRLLAPIKSSTIFLLYTTINLSIHKHRAQSLQWFEWYVPRAQTIWRVFQLHHKSPTWFSQQNVMTRHHWGLERERQTIPH